MLVCVKLEEEEGRRPRGREGYTRAKRRGDSHEPDPCSVLLMDISKGSNTSPEL